MLVSRIQPKEIWISLDFPLSELKHIKRILDHAEIQFDGKNEPEMEVSNAYVLDHFYPIISKVIKDIEEG